MSGDLRKILYMGKQKKKIPKKDYRGDILTRYGIKIVELLEKYEEEE
jgi:hypothetical protein